GPCPARHSHTTSRGCSANDAAPARRCRESASGGCSAPTRCPCSCLAVAADVEGGQEGLEEVNVLFGPVVLAGEIEQDRQILADAVQLWPAEALQVTHEVLQRLLAGGRFDDLLVGTDQEDDRVQ